MSLNNMNLVWNLDKTDLTGTQVNILARLAWFGDDDGNSIYPSYNRIALDTGISRQAVIYNIKQLEAKNLISKSCANDGSTNQYKLNVSLLEKLQRKKIKLSHHLESSQHPELLDKKPVNEVDYPSQGDLPPLVNEVDYPSQGGLPKRNIKKYKSNNKERSSLASSAEDVCFNSNKVQPEQVSGSRKKRATSKLNHANDEPFSQLYEIWPRKERKLEARQSFDTKAISPEMVQKIIEGAKSRVEDWRKKGTDVRFTTQLPNWLRGECWNDEIFSTSEMLNTCTSARERRKDASKRKTELEIENLMRQHNLNKVNGNYHEVQVFV